MSQEALTTKIPSLDFILFILKGYFQLISKYNLVVRDDLKLSDDRELALLLWAQWLNSSRMCPWQESLAWENSLRGWYSLTQWFFLGKNSLKSDTFFWGGNIKREIPSFLMDEIAQ
jgi:hypothetical protein